VICDADGTTVGERNYPRTMPGHQRKTLLWAGLYGVSLLVIGLWPSHVDQNFNVVGLAPVQWFMHGFDLTRSQTYDVVEFSANVALFVPLGVFAMTWSPRSRWIHAVLLGLAVSGAIELTQEVARPDRTASWTDVAANTTGASLGAALVLVWLWRRRESAGT
jgi:VanZ family protein